MSNAVAAPELTFIVLFLQYQVQLSHLLISRLSSICETQALVFAHDLPRTWPEPVLQVHTLPPVLTSEHVTPALAFSGKYPQRQAHL